MFHPRFDEFKNSRIENALSTDPAQGLVEAATLGLLFTSKCLAVAQATPPGEKVKAGLTSSSESMLLDVSKPVLARKPMTSRCNWKNVHNYGRNAEGESSETLIATEQRFFSSELALPAREGHGHLTAEHPTEFDRFPASP
jgi:hypothetical protein